MSDLAIAEPSSATKRPKAAARVRIPHRVARAVDLIASGECKTIKAAAEQVKLNPIHLGRMLKKPQVEALIARRSREIIQRASLRAAGRMSELIDSPNQNVSFNASSFALRSAGIGPDERAQVAVSVGISVNGYMVDLGDAAAPGRTIDGTATDTAGDKGEQDQ